MERRNESWTPEERSKLKKLLDLGLTVEEISRVLERTVLGVLYVMWREGMTAAVCSLNRNSMTVKRLLNCKSEKITGICKELFNGDFAPGRQEFVLRALLTLDIPHDKWVARKRKEQLDAALSVHSPFETTLTDIFLDFTKLEEEIAVQLLELQQRQQNDKTSHVWCEFTKLVADLSSQLQVPPSWVRNVIHSKLQH